MKPADEESTDAFIYVHCWDFGKWLKEEHYGTVKKMKVV
jgi:hypothetical protein